MDRKKSFSAYLNENVRLFRLLFAAGFVLALAAILLTPARTWIYDYFGDHQDVLEGYTGMQKLATAFTEGIFLPGLGGAVFALLITVPAALLKERFRPSR